MNAHLAERRLTPMDVTSSVFGWVWNRAWLGAREAGDSDTMTFLRAEFPRFALAQHRHDAEAARDWFGETVPGIAWGRNVAFFAAVATEYFGTLIDACVTFVALEETLTGARQAAVGSVTSSELLILRQKLAAHSSRPTAKIAPEMAGLFARVVEMASAPAD